jgi:hypothetical protein
MRFLKWGAIILAALVVFLGIGLALNVVGYAHGQGQGYEVGKVEGYDKGHSEGYDKGQLVGYQEGQSKGYDEGQGKGYTTGRADAVSKGFLGNPTYQEMKDFLDADTTNTKQQIKGEYESYDMVADINKNAEAQGIRTAMVYIEFAGGAWTLLAFETTDRGRIFINPSTDGEMKVKVGIKYWEDNSYGKGSWDDTIKEVVVSW